MHCFVLLKDAAISYRPVYFLKIKGDVLEYFEVYNAMIKNKYVYSVKS